MKNTESISWNDVFQHTSLAYKPNSVLYKYNDTYLSGMYLAIHLKQHLPASGHTTLHSSKNLAVSLSTL